MKSGKAPGTLRVLAVCAGITGYFGTAVYALSRDDALLGCIFIIGTFAVISVLVTIEKIKARAANKRLLKYGRDPALLLERLSLPEDPEKRLAAVRILAGESGAEKLPEAGTDGRELPEAMERLGLLGRLDAPGQGDKAGGKMTARIISDIVNALLKNTGLSGRLPSIIESDITALGNRFIKARRAGGLDTGAGDLNAAAYLLREKGIEPVILTARDGDNTPEYIALAAAEDMYVLCGLCGGYSAPEVRI